MVIVLVGASSRGEKPRLSPPCSDLIALRRETVKSSASSHVASSSFPFLRNQGGGPSLGTVDDLVSIPSFDAKLTLVHGSSFWGYVSDQAAVRDFEKHPAAATAIRTSGCDKPIIHGRYRTPCQCSGSEGHSLEITSASQQQTLPLCRVSLTVACCRGLCQPRHKATLKTFPTIDALFRPGRRKDSRGQNQMAVPLSR